MIPYYDFGETFDTANVGKRSIGLAYLDSPIQREEYVEVDIRGKRFKAVIPHSHMSAKNPPYVRPIIWKEPNE